jgi:trehalose 6-phosphate synthase/phosphatase
LTPLSFRVGFGFCAMAVGRAERKKGTAKAVSSRVLRLNALVAAACRTVHGLQQSKIMGKQTIFVSNRLAVRVDRGPEGLTFHPSVGGLATGLSSVSTGSHPPLWVGWSGLAEEDLSAAQRDQVRQELRANHAAVAVPLSRRDLELFYSGYCNDTIWPLFHYFPTYAEYLRETWESYRAVNRRFFEVLAAEMEPDATVWVHDYHLMLLPGLIREHFPRAQTGFFLHIPFPSYELFRLLPAREQILEGLLGADLIGFHTYDYARHFLSSVRHLLGHDHAMGVIRTANRVAKVDVFPMGIDWDRFSGAESLPEVQAVQETLARQYGGRKLILSVDRLDYSKGIPTRITAFRRLLERYPEHIGTVVLLIVVSPSRESVPQYMELKREVDELVSDINGRWSNLDWDPIHYQYQTASFHELNAMYRQADVLLVTPLRDGMNLIAKEYIAARNDGQGVLVLSETAGAARELSEAIQINPSDLDEIADAMNVALDQTPDEQAGNMAAMRERVRRFTVEYWAGDFLEKLRAMRAVQATQQARPLDATATAEIEERWNAAAGVLLFLDCDGMLVRFHRRPDVACPDASLLELLRNLNSLDGVNLVLSSGRDCSKLERWFGAERFLLGAGQGAWIREEDGNWHAAPVQVPDWKDAIRPILQRMVDRTPGASMEEKDFSLAWHYRNSDPELATVRMAELREILITLTNNLELSVLDGNRFLEVKPAHIHPGRIVHHFLDRAAWDLVVAIGNDATDETMFQALPPEAISIKVGIGATAAEYFIDGVERVRQLLHSLCESRRTLSLASTNSGPAGFGKTQREPD